MNNPSVLSTFRPFNLSSFRPLNPSPLNLSTFRPFNLSTFRPFNLLTFRPLNLSSFQRFVLSTFQPFVLSNLSSFQTFRPFNLLTFRAVTETCKDVTNNDMILLDSGGQYLDGTTGTSPVLFLFHFSSFILSTYYCPFYVFPPLLQSLLSSLFNSWVFNLSHSFTF